MYLSLPILFFIAILFLSRSERDSMSEDGINLVKSLAAILLFFVAVAIVILFGYFVIYGISFAAFSFLGDWFWLPLAFAFWFPIVYQVAKNKDQRP